MAEIIEMPKLSDTMSVGTIVSWLKQEGDAIASGDMIAEIETDKATMEMEVFLDGVLLKQYAKAGDQVAVGEPIAAIGDKGESVPEAGGSAKSGKESSATPEKEAKTSEESPKQEESPAAQEPKTATEPSPSKTGDTGNQDSGARIKASPLARKLASDKGIDLSTVKGSGPGGRIVRKNILEAKPVDSSKAVASEAAASTAIPVQKPSLEDRAIPVSNMRGIIAKRLLESKTQIPHFYLDLEVDMAPLLKLRETINAKTASLPPEKGGIKFSVNDFILKAATEALKRVPAANASWMGDKIIQHGDVHMAFAVAVEDGLLTPTIKQAQNKSLTEISLEAKSLISKAQNKKLKPEEMSGSTFTVTNLGMYGITSFYGIINPPNAAILSVGATVRKPVVDANGNIVPGDRMHIGLSGDHRVVDGAVGAQYLSTLKEIIESPALMLIG